MDKNSNEQQTNKSNIKNIGTWGVILLLTVVSTVVGIITKRYWLLWFDAVIIFLFIYFITIAIFSKKIDTAISVHCDPYKYYRYYKILRGLCFFVRCNKNDYKTELAIGLRNQGKFDEAKRVLLSADVNKFSSPEFLVLYYNNLCDLLILLNDYTAAHDAIQKGFIALEKCTDEKIYERWMRSLTINLTCLQMREGITNGCEELFTTGLEKTKDEYEKMEAHANLGDYYFLTKQYGQALLHYEYIVQHGNKLFHVQAAKNQIAEINKLIAN